jgi:hypothetical protein
MGARSGWSPERWSDRVGVADRRDLGLSRGAAGKCRDRSRWERFSERVLQRLTGQDLQRALVWRLGLLVGDELGAL